MSSALIEDIAIKKLMERSAPEVPAVPQSLDLPKPWHLEVAEALHRFAMTFTLRSLVYWGARKPAAWVIEHGYSVVVTVFSGRVGPGEFADRQKRCSECSRQQSVRQHTYCGGCGCLKTMWSRLEYKNTKRGHDCPLGSHVGSRGAMNRRGLQGVTHGN